MKPLINKEILLQYVFDYGLEKACNMLKISTEKADELINPKPSENVYYERKMLKKRNSVNALMSQIIADNYNELYKEFVKNNDYMIISQSDEDVFHNVLTALLEDPTDVNDNMLNYIKSKINAAKQRHIADNKSYKKVMDNVDNYEYDLNIEDDANN